MVEIARSGRALIEDVNAAEPESGLAYFWWLGQHSFIVKISGLTVYIDPYLDPNPVRQTPPLLKPEEVTNANVVLCTHDHEDHIDPKAIPAIVPASPGALFVAPKPHRQRMLDLGVPEKRLHLMNEGDMFGWSDVGLSIATVKAKHEFFDEGPDGFPFLGYVLLGDGVNCYHSGDTLVYDGLSGALSKWTLDAAFLPINGRDAERYLGGCIGNMTYQEAVDLAGELGVKLAVPTHYDMFAHNAEDPQKFVRYLKAKFPGIPAWVGRAGERVAFGPAATSPPAAG
jgi:L-ascorbate 6-phosphate lactonase